MVATGRCRLKVQARGQQVVVTATPQNIVRLWRHRKDCRSLMSGLEPVLRKANIRLQVRLLGLTLARFWSVTDV